MVKTLAFYISCLLYMWIDRFVCFFYFFFSIEQWIYSSMTNYIHYSWTTLFWGEALEKKNSPRFCQNVSFRVWTQYKKMKTMHLVQETVTKFNWEQIGLQSFCNKLQIIHYFESFFSSSIEFFHLWNVLFVSSFCLVCP